MMVCLEVWILGDDEEEDYDDDDDDKTWCMNFIAEMMDDGDVECGAVSVSVLFCVRLQYVHNT